MIDITKDIIYPIMSCKKIKDSTINQIITGVHNKGNATPENIARMREYDLVYSALLGVARNNYEIRNVIVKALHKRVHSLTDVQEITRTTQSYLALLYPETIETYTNDRCKRSTGDENQKQQYPYIPYGLYQFIQTLVEAKDFLKGENFIDVGCGIGDKTFIAAFLSKQMTCAGIEYDSATEGISAGKNHYSNRPCSFQCEDALAYNFKYYDRIYTYQPIANQTILLKLYKHITKTMPVGGMWFEASSSVWNKFMKNNKRFKVIYKSGYPNYTGVKVVQKIR